MRRSVTTASFWLLLRMCTGHITILYIKKFIFILLRSRCLTKNYCSPECFTADEAVHAVCCKNKQEVEKRKMKIGGKAKAEVINQNLQEFQVRAQQKMQSGNYDIESHKLVTEALSKIRGLKVKDGNKEEKMAEVDSLGLGRFLFNSG